MSIQKVRQEKNCAMLLQLHQGSRREKFIRPKIIRLRDFLWIQVTSKTFITYYFPWDVKASLCVRTAVEHKRKDKPLRHVNLVKERRLKQYSVLHRVPYLLRLLLGVD
jgi:hypothetical protein